MNAAARAAIVDLPKGDVIGEVEAIAVAAAGELRTVDIVAHAHAQPLERAGLHNVSQLGITLPFLDRGRGLAVIAAQVWVSDSFGTREDPVGRTWIKLGNSGRVRLGGAFRVARITEVSKSSAKQMQANKQ